MASMSYLGIGSGMDMGTILEQLLAAKAKPITALQTQQSRVTAAQNAWTGIGSDLTSLTSLLDTLRTPSTYRPSKATGSDDKVATATVSGDLQADVSYQVKVNQLASAQTMYSRQFSGDATMGKAGTLQFASNDGERSFSVEYEAGTTLSQLSKKINEAAKAQATEDETKVFLNSSIIDGRLVLSGTDSGAKNGFTVSDSNDSDPVLGNFQLASGLAYRESASFTYSDVPLAGSWGESLVLTSAKGQEVTVNIDWNDSLESLTEKINQQFKAATGETKSVVQLAGSEGSYALRFDTSLVGNVNGLGVDNTAAVQYSGQDALLSVNGLTVRSAGNEVDLVEGLKISLKETGNTTFTVQNAADDVVSAVKDFINKFNSIYSGIKKRMENTLPTTTGTDPDEMTKLLNNRDPLVSDSSLRALANDLQDLFSYVGSEGSFKTLSSLGIEVNRDGTVKLDEDKLRKAVATDAEGVATFFRGVAVEGSATERSGGFAYKADAMLRRYTNAANGIIEGQKSYYTSLQDSYTKQINRMQESLAREEETLTKKFTQADVAMAKANNKLSTLQSMLGSASSSSSSDILASYGL